MSALTSHHKERYGEWAGRPNGVAADPDCCAKEVFPSERAVMHHQCRRKRGHGPEGAFCKQHDPEAVKRRQVEADRQRFEGERRRARNRKFAYGRPFIKALRQIAEGHNDPRALAAQVLRDELGEEPDA